MNLHSLDALLTTVRDGESRKLAQEAVTAYQAGAWRASILSIWVAVCADLIGKIRELATGGDAIAVADIQQLEVWIKSKDLRHLQAFENGLVSSARDKFGMLLQHEATDLVRLQDDRHLCAHPAFIADDTLFAPTPELVRTHITHAILHLLSRPPIQGKQLIERYDRDLRGGSLPKLEQDIELVLRTNYLANAKPSSITGLVKALAKALVGSESATYKGKENQIARSLAVIGRITPSIVDEHVPPLVEKLARDLGDEKILLLCLYMEAEPRIWEWLGSAGQARVLAKVQQSPLLDIVPAFRARHITAVGEQLLNALQKEELKDQETVLSKRPCKAFVQYVLDLYGFSKSFSTAEKRGSEILIPHAKYLSSEDIGKLNTVIRTNKHNQILHAGQTASILTSLFDQVRSLLPSAAPHWTEIAKYIVDKKAYAECEYPQFLAELKRSNVPIPEVPSDEGVSASLDF
ncbi:MAG: hypothetical protein V4662_07700 [Verrucomicrobiota bacterium]